MIFSNTFDNLKEDEIKLLNQYFDGYDYQSSGHTFLANYIWRNTHKITWEIIGDYLCLAGLGNLDTEEEIYFMSFPLTKDGTYEVEKLRQTLLEAKSRFEEKGMTFELGLIPGMLVPYLYKCFPQENDADITFCIEHDRDDDEYIYLKEDLVSLKGRKLHQKKNHLNYFSRNYEFTYEEIRPEIVPEIWEFIHRFNEEKLKETPDTWKEILELETIAIKELLDNLEKWTNLVTGVIRIKGQIEAVTIGEFAKTNDKGTVIVHVEKAASEFRGLYQAINNEFCKRLPDETVYVNREEDMGLETLRQTKMSYKPVKLAEKYSAFVK